MTVCVKERDRKREGVGGRWAGRRVGRLKERERFSAACQSRV